MEKVLHPVCACGQPVMVHESWSPCYDDGGGMDSIDIDISFDTECDICYIKRMEQKHISKQIVIEPDEDDLPF